MDIKSLILRRLTKSGEIKASNLTKEIGFSRAYINRFLRELRANGKIILLGKANQARYVLSSKIRARQARQSILSSRKNLKNKNLSEDQILNSVKKETGIFLNLPRNVAKILDYSFTEMLNNAIEHSGSKKIKINFWRDKNNVNFEVIDKGIGIFKNIMRKKNLKNELEAIQDLTKGKQTTAPKAHTGEGIFFTSKSADEFIVCGSDKKLIFNNIINDIFVKDVKKIFGTKVKFLIHTRSSRNLGDIFSAYSGDAFEFSKTRVVVKLFKIDTDYISRSQGRRVMSGLDKFKEILLDFKGVETVGQGFADEVFRVWKINNSKIEVKYVNANENIEFMIKRAL